MNDVHVPVYEYGPWSVACFVPHPEEEKFSYEIRFIRPEPSSRNEGEFSDTEMHQRAVKVGFIFIISQTRSLMFRVGIGFDVGLVF